DLEGLRNSALQRRLNGGHGRFGQRLCRRKDQDVPVIFDERNDPLAGLLWLAGAASWCIVGSFVRTVLFAPATIERVDIEAELSLVLAPTPAFVDSPNLSRWRISHESRWIRFAGCDGFGHVALDLAAGARHEAVGGLQLVPLPLALLFVCRDPLLRNRLHVLDLEQRVDAVRIREKSATMFADVGQGLCLARFAQVAVAAGGADAGADGGQRGVRRDGVGAGDVELGALDAEHPSGVINQAPRAKLGQGEKPRS